MFIGAQKSELLLEFLLMCLVVVSMSSISGICNLLLTPTGEEMERQSQKLSCSLFPSLDNWEHDLVC